MAIAPERGSPENRVAVMGSFTFAGYEAGPDAVHDHGVGAPERAEEITETDAQPLPRPAS